MAGLGQSHEGEKGDASQRRGPGDLADLAEWRLDPVRLVAAAPLQEHRPCRYDEQEQPQVMIEREQRPEHSVGPAHQFVGAEE